MENSWEKVETTNLVKESGVSHIENGLSKLERMYRRQSTCFACGLSDCNAGSNTEHQCYPEYCHESFLNTETGITLEH